MLNHGAPNQFDSHAFKYVLNLLQNARFKSYSNDVYSSNKGQQN